MRTCFELAAEMVSPVEIVVNILYLLEHRAGNDPYLFRAADEAIRKINALIRAELWSDGSI